MLETRINLDQNGHTAENQAKLIKIMKEIDVLVRNEREGARIREKLKHDDRSTKYFFRKEKQLGL